MNNVDFLAALTLPEDNWWLHMLLFGALILVVGVGLVLFWRWCMLRSITERKRTEQVDAILRTSENRFATIFHTSPVGIVITCLSDNRIEEVNAALLRLLGYAREEMIAHNALDMGIWNNLQDRQRLLSAMHTQRHVVDFETTFRKKSGESRNVLLSAEQIDLKNEPNMLIQIIDITERKRADALVYAQRDLARVIGTTSSRQVTFQHCLAIALRASHLDCGGIYLLNANNDTLELVCHQGVGADFISAASRYSLDAPNVVLLLSGHTFYLTSDSLREQELHHREGIQSMAAIPMLFQGRVIGSLNVGSHTMTHVPEFSQHIVETLAIEMSNLIVYLRAEESLRTSEEKFRLITETIDEVFWMMNTQMTSMHYVSPAYAHIWGQTQQSLYANPHAFLDAIHPDDREEALATLVKKRDGQLFELEYRIIQPDGTVRYIWDRGYPICDDHGCVTSYVGVASDITQRKQAEISLLTSKEQYRGLMESLDGVIAAVDIDGSFLYMNDVAAKQLGGLPKDFLGTKIGEFFPEPAASRQLANIRRVIQEDRGLISEQQTPIQGQIRWYRTSLQPIHDQTGHVIYALVNSTDIHDLKTAQQDLLELNRTLEERVAQRTAEVQDLYDNAPTGYHSLNASGAFILINQTELNWLGYTYDEILGRPVTDFLTPPSRVSFRSEFPVFKQRGWLRNFELEFIRRDGTTFPSLVDAIAIYDDTGAYVMSRSTVFDITLRKQAETALRESEAQNRLLFDAAPDAVILFDALGQVVRMNHAFEILSGSCIEQLIGHTLSDLGLLSEVSSSQLGAAVTQAFQQGERFATAEFKLTQANGASRDVGARVFGLQIQSEQYYLTTMRDITAEKQVEETLRMANAELARAARAKDEFLATMSHELRTPLNTILALSEILMEEIRGPINESQHESLHVIQTSGEHLLSLINDVLDLSKIEAGRLDLQVGPIEIGELCQASMLFVTEVAIKKSLLLDFHLHDQLAMVQADPKRLKQMLVNLLSNAVKFTPAKGQVSLEVTVDVAACVVRFAVRDTGIGIAPEDLGRLFQPFRQLDSGLTRQHEGTGLGLALVRRLADLHGGSITVESTLGMGSCFTITLPYYPPVNVQTLVVENSGDAAKQFARYIREPAPTGTRILLADDNEANLQATQEYLHAKGYQVLIVRNGQEALDQIAAIRPDVILMDIQMPKLNGLEAIRRLRAMPEWAATPIIALTALAMPNDREHSLAAGANEYLTKPVDLKKLVALIAQLVHA